MSENSSAIDELLEYFNSKAITVDTEIRSVLERACTEGGFTDLSTTFISYRDTVDQFCKDLTLDESLIVSIDDDDYTNLRGKCYDRATYLDNIEYHSTGDINVYDDGDSIMGLEYSEGNDTPVTIIPDLDEWSIVLLKSIEFIDSRVMRVNKLFIYCPFEPKVRSEVNI